MDVFALTFTLAPVIKTWSHCCPVVVVIDWIEIGVTSAPLKVILTIDGVTPAPANAALRFTGFGEAASPATWPGAKGQATSI